jgi:hypothetical protein
MSGTSTRRPYVCVRVAREKSVSTPTEQNKSQDCDVCLNEDTRTTAADAYYTTTETLYFASKRVWLRDTFTSTLLVQRGGWT